MILKSNLVFHSLVEGCDDNCSHNPPRENRIHNRGTFRLAVRMIGMEPHQWQGVWPLQWPAVARQLPRRPKQPFLKRRRRGGRPFIDDRLAFSAILWVMRTGCAWRRLPARFGSSATALRRLASWSRGPRLGWAWQAYLSQLGLLDLRTWGACFEAASLRREPLWRIELATIFRLEFAPLCRPVEPEYYISEDGFGRISAKTVRDVLRRTRAAGTLRGRD